MMPTEDEKLNQLVHLVRDYLVEQHCQIISASPDLLVVQINFANIPAYTKIRSTYRDRVTSLTFTVEFSLTHNDLDFEAARVIQQIKLKLLPDLDEADDIHHYIRSSSSPVKKVSSMPVKNLKINIILAIYIFILAIAVPSIVIAAITIGGQQFSLPLFALMGAGVIGSALSVGALIAARRRSMQTVGQILALSGTVMVSTGAMMILFFILVPLLIIAAWFLLRPRKRFEPMTITTPIGKQTIPRNGYELEKKALKQITSGNLDNVQLPLSLYFNTDFILKLIPLVGFSTIGVYIYIWINTRGKAQPGSTQPMFLSMALVLVTLVIIDLIVWLIWKQLARPIVTLDQAGLSYRKQQHHFFVPWREITDLTNVTVPSGQTQVTCLFVFALNPENYFDTNLHLPVKKEKFARWLHGIRPEYFQRDFTGVVLTIPINRLGIDQQLLLDLVTTIWKSKQHEDWN
ncbi:hypothetical protein [Loigolactobacillus binensis]|uniref:DUF2207 domain-containing protein n=1 Tax=Loigolactobacillus binensis TaxID=2559922 RepID=A0ABW3E8Q1_9LACO|nr:hypothetical protein [Loigolactobacillus binensis]